LARSWAKKDKSSGSGQVFADQGRFISLVRTQELVVVEYRDKDDLPQKEEINHFQLYKLQQRFYKNRGTFKPVDLWTGHDK